MPPRLPVLVQVCHDNNDVSSHSDLARACLHHVRKTRSRADLERPACKQGGIRSFLAACENPNKFQAQLIKEKKKFCSIVKINHEEKKWQKISSLV